MKINSYKDLVVWQRSIDLVKTIYVITKRLPGSEIYGLSSQLQRAVVSIPSNIAEGSKRSGKSDFRHFCMMADGSAAEVETQLIIISKLYPEIDLHDSQKQLTEIQKMLSSLISRLR